MKARDLRLGDYFIHNSTICMVVEEELYDTLEVMDLGAAGGYQWGIKADEEVCPIKCIESTSVAPDGSLTVKFEFRYESQTA